MNILGRTRARRQVLTRAVVAIAAAFIMLALHDAVATASHDDVNGAESGPVVAALIDGQTHAGAADATVPGPDGGLAVECGLAILCVVAIVSMGAMLLPRGRRSDAALWSTPRARRVVVGDARSAYQVLAPLQTTCVLRC